MVIGLVLAEPSYNRVMKRDWNQYWSSFGLSLALISFSSLGQTPSNQQMQTFSPYTPEQLKAFNDQKVSPVESPFGPVESNQQSMNLQQNPKINPQSFNIPTGEQEAEALEMQSAEPYQPLTPVLTF